MKHGFILALGACALALSACGSKTDTETTATNSGSVTDISTDTDNGTENATVAVPAMSGQEFADAAASTDAYEIEAGKLAEQKATDQKLKDFGKMMVDNHTTSTAKLKAAAGKADPAITPNPKLDPEQSGNLEALRAATGADFDALYKQQQVAAHQKALAAMKGYGETGSVPQLKDFASDTASIVQTHLDKILGL
ncbi:DUF4142 domain-containing protein [Sphingomonas sp.]|uniref:DUF4142 domain-containing protein n=1 Tax=Sphingomonas sp. TaxID=28214 RepID=UPI001B18B5B2|nr:DUF4142 domain-containing protein [Sphingomonas sp.]MBO9714278.1 DUF4142 domain-containing protein [Sphingomonas sp.]